MRLTTTEGAGRTHSYVPALSVVLCNCVKRMVSYCMEISVRADRIGVLRGRVQGSVCAGGADGAALRLSIAVKASPASIPA